MSSDDRRAYFRQYSKKYYQQNKETINKRKKVANLRRYKLMNIVYRYWRQGNLIVLNQEQEQALQKELSRVDIPKAKIVFEDD